MPLYHFKLVDARIVGDTVSTILPMRPPLKSKRSNWRDRCGSAAGTARHELLDFSHKRKWRRHLHHWSIPHVDRSRSLQIAV